MPFSIIQAGDTLQAVSETGVITTLVLPTGVTLRTDVKPRFLVNDRYIVMVNTPSLPLTIDAKGKVRLLTPRAPRLGPILSNVNGGALTGTYFSKYTFVVVDDIGNLISESDFSPISNTFALTTDFLKAANLDISPDEISGRRIYRTTTDGAVLFQWIDLDGNVLTEVQDDLSDAGLSLFASPILGSPPNLTHIGEFRGRLFGVGSDRPDFLRYTEAGFRYSWPEDNGIIIPPEGSDITGITALIGRRDALGVGRLNSLWQIVGSGEETADIVDLEPVRLSEECGVVSQESVDVFRDTAYFLWYDGVYQWNSEGVRCISDGEGNRGNVRKWFTTDDYFNRSRFIHAFGRVDPVRQVYKLFLAAPDSLVDNRWIEYDIVDKTWWGPNLTAAFTPLSIFGLTDAGGSIVLPPVIGSVAFNIYKEQQTRTDGAIDGIAMHLVSKQYDIAIPDYEKYFGEISVLGIAKAAGTVLVESRVGELDATTAIAHNWNMLNNRQRLGRIGVGKHAELEFTHSTIGQTVEIMGFEINPVHVVGRR